MNRSRGISIEIYRDIETPDVDISAVVEGLEEVRDIVPSLEIIARNSLLRVSEPGAGGIYTDHMPQLAMEADFGMIVTGQQLLVPESSMNRIIPGNFVIGNTWPFATPTPYSLVDAARGLSPRITAKHEVGHLFQIPRRGLRFDGDCHCTDGNCIMHAVLSLEREDFCGRCAKQLGKSAMKLVRRKPLEPEPLQPLTPVLIES